MELLILAIAGVVLWLWYESGQGSSPVSPGSSGGTSSGNPNLDSFANAIYNFEGGGGPNATNSWNNNPGNIGGGQSTYPSLDSGWQALYSFISGKASANPNWNFYDFFSNYLGTPGNLGTTAQGNATDYANYVASQVGANPNQSVWGWLTGSNS